MSNRPTALNPTPSAAVMARVRQLEDNLRMQVDVHETLLSLLKRKRAALREANHAFVTSCCQQENTYVQQIGELEKQRQGLIGQLTGALSPNSAKPLTMAELAARLPEPARGRLLVRRQQLKQRMEEAREEAATTRQAMEVLASHMRGLVKTMGDLVTGGSTYSNCRVQTPRPTRVSTFSVTA